MLNQGVALVLQAYSWGEMMSSSQSPCWVSYFSSEERKLLRPSSYLQTGAHTFSTQAKLFLEADESKFLKGIFPAWNGVQWEVAAAGVLETLV